jgi:hypothetical protein
MGPHNT